MKPVNLFFPEVSAGMLSKTDSSATLHVGRPNVGDPDEFLRRAEQILASGRLSNDGPTVRRFEARVCETLGVRHAVAVCNATLGLQVAAKSLGLTGEVIMPSFTFVATAHAFEWIGLQPVFVDIDPRTHNVDPDRIDEAITDRTSCVVGVHLWGRPCDTQRIEEIAENRGLCVMYDASHAFGSCSAGRMIGNFGSCEVFSFHATKFVHTFEGGVVTTNDEGLAAKMRLMRNFGFQGYDNVVSAGINAKMPEISAAMGLGCLEAMDKIVEANRRSHLAYREQLQSVDGVSVVQYEPAETNNCQYVVVEVDPDVCSLSRDEIVEVLHSENIIARKYFWPGCHRMEPYRATQPEAWQRLPETERVAERVIVLPAGASMGEEDVRRVCGIIRNAATKR